MSNLLRENVNPAAAHHSLYEVVDRMLLAGIHNDKGKIFTPICIGCPIETFGRQGRHFVT